MQDVRVVHTEERHPPTDGRIEVAHSLTGRVQAALQGADHRGELDLARLDDDANNQLGVNVIAGERIWDVTSSFRLRIGPLDLATFQDLLPDRTPRPRRKAFFLLSQLVRLYVGPEFDFEVQFVLKGPQVPECEMKDASRDVLGTRLGWNSWLKDGTMPDVERVTRRRERP